MINRFYGTEQLYNPSAYREEEFLKHKQKVVTEAFNNDMTNYHNYGIEERVILRTIPKLFLNKFCTLNDSDSKFKHFLNNCKWEYKKLGPAHDVPYHGTNISEDEMEYAAVSISKDLIYELDNDFIKKLKHQSKLNDSYFTVSDRSLLKGVIKNADRLIRKYKGHNGNIVILLSPLVYSNIANKLKERYPNVNLIWNNTEKDNKSAIVGFVDNNRNCITYDFFYCFLKDYVTEVPETYPIFKCDASVFHALSFQKQYGTFVTLEVKQKQNIFTHFKKFLYNVLK